MKNFQVEENERIDLNHIETEIPTSKTKKQLKKSIKKIVKQIDALQYNLYAEDRRALLIVFQGIDAAGKDSSIRAIFSGLNPSSVVVSPFKAPSQNELEHDYLWRHYLQLPQRGKIRVFNRSHYENVLVTKVHKEYLLHERLPNIYKVEDVPNDFFEKRYEDINNFEQHLLNSGTEIIKFFLFISKDEQKQRFIDRIEESDKNWKFSQADVKERPYWDEYLEAYSDMLEKTSKNRAPWYVMPCDNKKAAQLEMAKIIHQKLEEMNPQCPTLDTSEKEELMKYYDQLKSGNL